MSQDETTIFDPHSTFSIPSWHSECEGWLKTCEDYWTLFQRELDKSRLDPRLAQNWDTEIVYYDFQNRYVDDLPPIVKAAAGCRWSFAILIDQLWPEIGIDVRGDEDRVERAIADSPDWKEAVQIALGSINDLKEKVAATKPDWNITADTNLSVVLAQLSAELRRQVRAKEDRYRPQHAALSKSPLTKTNYTRAPADRINKAVIEALAPGALTSQKSDKQSERLIQLRGEVAFWGEYSFRSYRSHPEKDELNGVIALRERPDAETLRLLHKNSHLAVKIHLALWERSYLETAAKPGTSVKERMPSSSEYVTMTVARLCDDIGLERINGAHKPEHRDAVIALLKLMMNLEVLCDYKPRRSMVTHRIRGPVWKYDVRAEEVGRYSDLFAAEQQEQGSNLRYAFSYAPGDYFDHPAWREDNKFMARVHPGLLSMSCKIESRWPVMVGAYLSLLARMKGYKETRVSFGTLSKKTGLWAMYRKKYPGFMEEKLEEAMDYLKKIGVIQSGQWDASRNAKLRESETSDKAQTSKKSKKPKNRSASTRWPEEEMAPSIITINWPEPIAKRAEALKVKKKKAIGLRGRQSSRPG